MTRIALTITDLPGSVLAQHGYLQRFAYTPFGGLPARIAGASAYHSLWLEDGYYLPGNGYRVYLPALMRFHSPDDQSPFNAGGLNAYVFSLANPVNHSDPSGRSPIRLWRALKRALDNKLRKFGMLKGVLREQLPAAQPSVIRVTRNITLPGGQYQVNGPHTYRAIQPGTRPAVIDIRADVPPRAEAARVNATTRQMRRGLRNVGS